MVKRVPADIADIVYSAPVRGYAHKLWNLPEALHFRVLEIGAGDLGIRLQFRAFATYLRPPTTELDGVDFGRARPRVGLVRLRVRSCVASERASSPIILE